jgi:hypothetical protein
MRILGWALIAIGIGGAAAALFGARGGNFSVIRLLTVCLVLVGTGWTLRAKGPGERRRVPHAGSGTVVGQSDPDAFTEGTVDIPLTPEVSALIARDAARQNRSLAVGVACLIGAGQLLGLGMYLFRRKIFPDIPPNDPWCIWIYVIGAGTGAAVALLIGIVGVVAGALARRDRRERTYLRTTGSARLDSIQKGFILRLVDRSFTVDSKRVAPALRHLDWVSIDYSRHAHIVLAVRNRVGVDVYCVDGYRRPVAVR